MERLHSGMRELGQFLIYALKPFRYGINVKDLESEKVDFRGFGVLWDPFY